MKISIIGVGYVGLATGISLCLKGYTVSFYDSDQEKIKSFKRGKVPFAEEDIEEAIKECLSNKNAIFADNLKEVLENSDIIFLCIGTPILSKGESDLTNIKNVCIELRKLIKQEVVVNIKSTVNPGDYLEIKNLLNTKNIHLAVNPEFLREGSALQDALHPTRILVGTDDEYSKKILKELYSKFESPKIFTDPMSAIITKYASNSFLAVKISFINEIANICDIVGASIDDVSLGIGLDPRIGKDYLKAGIGYGGSCLPKDTKNLIRFAEKNSLSTNIVKATDIVNENQYKVVIKKLTKNLETLENKVISVLGLSFKGGTDDLRGSVSLKLVEELKKSGAVVKAHDYLSYEKAKKIIKYVFLSKDVYAVVKDADAVVIATDWKEYTKLDWEKIKELMKGNLIVDGRNLLDPKLFKELGFVYEGIGRK
jgi:UDPglucose 6-dehydrogenase